MSSIAIIPARMGSSRFPGKPLVQINGVPMILAVCRRVLQCKNLDLVVVATCDEEIEATVVQEGIRCVMTSAEHERASDRCAEALEHLEREGLTFHNVVMVQGDEPLVTASMIDKALDGLSCSRTEFSIVNLLGSFFSESDYLSPNSIKVVYDSNMRAKLMTRTPIYDYKDVQAGRVPVGKQVCVIPFTAASLRAFNSLPPTSLEMIESIDMNRTIQSGFFVDMVRISEVSHPVDVPEDIKVVLKLLEQSH